jgi:hypothetical protein
MFIDVGRAKVLNWLVTVNPSINHNQALDLYQQGTCGWILTFDQWLEWKDRIRRRPAGLCRGIWIHGIPGAGKTVLAAFLAKRTMMIRDSEDFDAEGDCLEVPDNASSPDIYSVGASLLEYNKTILQKAADSCLQDLESHLPRASVYYYCYHGRNHDETSHFLRWLLNQLCRQAATVPINISRLFATDCQPHTEDLIEAIKAVSARFSRIFVTIDAIDESDNREVITQLLYHMATSEEFSVFYIVVLSRKEVDIERQFHNFISVSMSNERVNRDIGRYIDSQLLSERKFQRWSPALRNEIKEALLNGANGM